MSNESRTRRQILKSSIGVFGMLAGSSAIASTLRGVCGLTPAQTEGPFYPVKDQQDKDNDLTLVKGNSRKALGQEITILGQVMDQTCNPVSGALVEIWQACASGKYNHPADTNAAPLDPNFQYWGQDVSDANGQFQFKTVLPGAYPADVDWIRPPHIHFKAHKLGYHELTTQLYFQQFEELNSKDKILEAIPAIDRDKVVVELINSICRFDLTLRSVRLDANDRA